MAESMDEEVLLQLIQVMVLMELTQPDHFGIELLEQVLIFVLLADDFQHISLDEVQLGALISDLLHQPREVANEVIGPDIESPYFSNGSVEKVKNLSYHTLRAPTEGPDRSYITGPPPDCS